MNFGTTSTNKPSRGSPKSSVLGAGLVEIAIIMTVAAAVVFGIITIGIMMYRSGAAQQSVNAAGQYLLLNPDLLHTLLKEPHNREGARAQLEQYALSNSTFSGMTGLSADRLAPGVIHPGKHPCKVAVLLPGEYVIFTGDDGKETRIDHPHASASGGNVPSSVVFLARVKTASVLGVSLEHTVASSHITDSPGGSTTGSDTGSTSGVGTGVATGTGTGVGTGVTTGASTGASTGPSSGTDAGTASGVVTGAVSGASSGAVTGTSAGVSSGTGTGTGTGTGAGAGAASGASAGVQAGAAGGTSAGTGAGTDTGAPAGPSTGSSAGTDAGTASGTSGGASSGLSSGTSGGASSGVSSGSSSGSASGATSGSTTGSASGTTGGTSAGASSGATSGSSSGASSGSSAGSASGSSAGSSGGSTTGMGYPTSGSAAGAFTGSPTGGNPPVCSYDVYNYAYYDLKQDKCIPSYGCCPANYSAMTLPNRSADCNVFEQTCCEDQAPSNENPPNHQIDGFCCPLSASLCKSIDPITEEVKGECCNTLVEPFDKCMQEKCCSKNADVLCTAEISGVKERSCCDGVCYQKNSAAASETEEECCKTSKVCSGSTVNNCCLTEIDECAAEYGGESKCCQKGGTCGSKCCNPAIELCAEATDQPQQSNCCKQASEVPCASTQQGLCCLKGTQECSLSLDYSSSECCKLDEGEEACPSNSLALCCSSGQSCVQSNDLTASTCCAEGTQFGCRGGSSATCCNLGQQCAVAVNGTGARCCEPGTVSCSGESKTACCTADKICVDGECQPCPAERLCGGNCCGAGIPCGDPITSTCCSPDKICGASCCGETETCDVGTQTCVPGGADCCEESFRNAHPGRCYPDPGLPPETDGWCDSETGGPLKDLCCVTKIGPPPP